MAINVDVCEAFRNTFEQRCFQLIIGAYKTSLNEKVIQLDWIENDISSELLRHIIENPLRRKWKVSTNVEAKIPKDIPRTKGFADKLPRIDFRLTTFISAYEYEYFFEAKNLKQNDSALKRRYIDTGINNFASKKYTNGSLIGYLLEGKTNETVEGINSLLAKDGRNTEILKSVENRSLKTYFESNHSNIGILKHLFFDFTDLSNL
jgi:hypothetical protein